MKFIKWGNIIEMKILIHNLNKIKLIIIIIIFIALMTLLDKTNKNGELNLIESEEKTENINVCLNDSFVKKNDTEEKTQGDKLLSEEFLMIQGNWEIIEFIDRGIDSHSEDIYEENQKRDWEAYRKEREKSVGTKLEIREETIEYCLPAGEDESGYNVNSYDGMFFGYKPPITMGEAYPVLRFYIEFKDFESPVYFILDANGKGIVDVNGDFYLLKRY